MFRRIPRWLKWVSLFAIPLFFVYVGVYLGFNDQRLAQYVMTVANQQICGRLTVDSLHWELGNPELVDVHNLRITGPDGRPVIEVPRAHARVELLPLRSGNLLVHDIAPRPGAHVVVDTDPDHGFFAAFASCRGGKRHVGEPPTEGGPRVHFDGQLEDAQVEVRLGPTLALSAQHTASPFGADVQGRRVRLSLTPRSPAGTLELLGAKLPMADLAVSSFGVSDARPDDLAFDLRARVADAPVHVGGAVLGISAPAPGLEVAIDVEHGGQAVKRLVAAQLAGLDVGGAQASGHLRLSGPLVGFKLTADAQGLDAAVEGVAASVSGAAGHVELDTARNRLQLAKVGAQVLSGRIEVPSADLDLLHGTLAARIHLSDVDIGPLLARDQRALAGRLSGRTRLAGRLGGAIRAHEAELSIERASAKDGLPRRIKLAGDAALDLKNDRLTLDGLNATGDALAATASGSVGLRSHRLDLKLSAQAAPLASILRRVGAPEDLARAVHARGQVGGTFERPSARGDLEVDDLGIAKLRIPHTTAQLALDKKQLSLADIHGGSPLGSLGGQARVRLDGSEGDVTLTLRDLDLSYLGAGLAGRAAVDVQASGRPDRPSGAARVKVQGLSIAGDPYSAAEAHADLRPTGAHITRLRLERARGGSVAGTGAIGWDGIADLRLEAADFPLAAIPALGQLPVDIRGAISGKIAIQGPLDAPRPAGEVRLSGARVGDVALGDGTLSLVPGGDAIHLSGSFFRRFKLDGTLTVSPGFALSASISFDKVPLEQIFPVLARLGEVRGIASGRVELSIGSSGTVHVAARLSDLRLTAHVAEEDGTPHQLSLVNEDEVRVVYDGARLRFDHLHLQSDKGELLVAGYLDPSASNLDVRGKVDLELIEYFAHQVFQHTHGSTDANLHVAGPMKRPIVTGTLSLNNVQLRPVDFDHTIHIPTGLLTFSNDGVELKNFVVAVRESQARAQGRLGLSDWQPQNVHLEITGQLSAKLLELLAPRVLGETQGAAQVDVVLDGPAQNPLVRGKVAVASPGIDLEVRHYNRHLRVLEGEIDFDQHRLSVQNLHGKVDDGDVRVSGSVSLLNWQPRDVRLGIRAVDLPHREPNVYDITLNADLHLSGSADEGLALGGSVDVVDGRYIEQFKILENAVIRPRTREESEPFWKDIPLLEELALDLTVNSTGPIYVDNDLAHQLKLETHLQVGGTLSDPDLSGEVRVLEGAFRIPFLRGDDFIALPGGTVTFYRGKIIPDETPELEITAEKSYTDANDQEYQIILRIHGALGSLQWDLTTNTGLTTGQTLLLLTTGRAPTEFRAELRGGTAGPAGGGTGSTADTGTKELSAQILQELVSNPINQVLRLDLFTLYVGPESVDVKERKRLLEHPRLDIVGLQSIGILSRSVYEGRLELKLHDYMFVDSQIQHFSFTQGTETEDDVLTRGKVQLRVRYRIRF